MRPTLAVRPALAVAAVLLAATRLHAAPAPVAVLPSVGTASEDARRDLDGALRQALLDEDRVDLLSPVETRAHVMSLAELGLVCLPEDTTCLVKLGTVAHVTFLLVPVGNVRADASERKVLDVEVGVIDVQHEKRVRLVKASFDPEDEAQAVAIVERALDLPARQKPTTTPTTTTTTTTTTPPTTTPTTHPRLDAGDGPPPATPEEAPPSLGTVVTATSGVVGASALLAALGCDLVYADILPLADAKTRKNVVQPVGAALWVTTGLAAAGVGAGLYLLLGPAPSEP